MGFLGQRHNRRSAVARYLAATVTAASALFAAGPAGAVVVRDDVGLVASQDTANANPAVVQIFLLDNLTGDIFFNCTGTLINPRTVITAAHCANFVGSEDYNPSALGYSMVISSGPNTQTRLFNFALGGLSYAQGGAALSSDVIVHPASNLENFGLPFPFGDIAMIALAEPITNIGRMDLMLSPMPGPFHATIAAYGGFGTGSTGDVGIGFNRLVGENNVDMLGSMQDLFRATTGTPIEDYTQNLYWIDMDDPNRPTAVPQCTNGAGTLGFPACSSVAAFNDINWFGGNALAREAGTAGGDSGSALIIDQAFARKFVAGVLSGGWNWDFFYPGLGVPGGYGDQSYYNPLYLYHEFISQNTPYKYVSAKAGGGDWDNPATWTQNLDPGFYIINGSGQAVNGLPTGAEPGVGGTTPKWGDVQGTSIAGFDTTPLPGLPFSSGTPLADGALTPLPAMVAVPDPANESANLSADMEAVAANKVEPRALIDLTLPSSPLLGPGSTNFVPMNTDGSPGTAFANPALYYEVWLNRAGTVTLNSLKDIDRLELNHADARLWIRDTGGDLLTVIETMALAGTLTVDGNLFSPSVINMFGSTINGHGDIYTTLLQNQARIAPGNSIGTLTVNGNFIQGAAGLLEIEVTNGSSDLLAVTGSAQLGGTLLVKQFGAAPLDGQVFTILTATSVTGTFANVLDELPGLLSLRPVVYGANFVQIEIDALAFSELSSGPIEDPVAAVLDALGGTPGMATAINNLQQLNASQIPAALEALNPTRAHAQAMVGLSTGDLLRNQLGRRTHDLLGGSMPTSTAQRDLTGSQLASVSPTSDMLASAALAALDGEDNAANGGSTIELPNGHAMFFAADVGISETDQAGGIGKDKADVAALTAGLDHTGRGYAIGGALSYLQSSVSQNYGLGGDTSSEGVAVSGFASMHKDLFYADAFLAYAWHDFETERAVLLGPLPNVSFASGETSASQSQAGITLGYGLNKDAAASFGAVGGLYYISMDIDGYTETGAGPLSAVLPSRSVDSLRSQLGGEVAFRLEPENETLVPIIRVVWNHEFEDDGNILRAGFAGAPTTTFAVPGPDLGSDWATVGFGLSGRISDGTSFYLRYQHDIGRDGQENQEVSAAARMTF